MPSQASLTIFTSGYLVVARGARRPLEVDHGLAEPDPGHEAADEAVAFAERLQRVHHLPAHQPELPDVRLRAAVGGEAHGPVEQPRGERA